MIKVLLLAGALALFGWLLMRRRQRGEAATRKAIGDKSGSKSLDKASSVSSRPARDWRSVTILSTFSSCDAARSLEGQVFLSTEAPSLPLADCDHANCRCRYEYLDDRRQEDRRSLYGERHGAQIGSNVDNRRQPGDRRE